MSKRRKDRPEAAPRAAAEALVAALGRDGTVDSHGEFTVDPARARELLAGFRLADPPSWAAELIQTAVLLGATRLDAEVDGTRVRIRFDGAPLERAELELLDSTLLSRPVTPRQRAVAQLAAALHGASALRPSRVRVTSAGPEGGVELVRRPDAPDQLEARRGVPPDTEVLVERAAPGTGAEADRLESLGQHAGLTLRVNGRSVAQGLTLPDAVCVEPVAGEGFSGVALISPAAAEPVLRLVQHGLVIAREAVPGAPWGVQVLVDVPEARRDLGLGKAVVDERLVDLRRAAGEAVSRVLAAARVLLPDLRSVATQEVVRTVVRAAAFGSGGLDPATVSSLPLWLVLDGDGAVAHVSTDQLREQPRCRYHLSYTSLSPEALSPVLRHELAAPDQVILASVPAEVEALAAHLGWECHDVSEKLLPLAPPPAPERLRWHLKHYGIGWLLATAAAVLLTIAIVCTVLLRDRLSWPATPAEVIEARWSERTAKKSKTFYSVDVRLRYTVRGTAYEHSSRLDTYEKPARAKERVAALLRDRQATVYYDPARPSRAMLEPERWDFMGGVLGCGVPGLILLLLAVGGWSEVRQKYGQELAEKDRARLRRHLEYLMQTGRGKKKARRRRDRET